MARSVPSCAERRVSAVLRSPLFDKSQTSLRNIHGRNRLPSACYSAAAPLNVEAFAATATVLDIWVIEFKAFVETFAGKIQFGAIQIG